MVILTPIVTLEIPQNDLVLMLKEWGKSNIPFKTFKLETIGGDVGNLPTVIGPTYNHRIYSRFDFL